MSTKIAARLQQAEQLLEVTFRAFMREHVRFQAKKIRVFKLSRVNELHQDLFISALVFAAEYRVNGEPELRYTVLLVDGTHQFGTAVGRFPDVWTLASVYDDHYRYNVEKLLAKHWPKIGDSDTHRLDQMQKVSRSLGVGVLPVGFGIENLLVTSHVGTVMTAPFSSEAPPMHECRHWQHTVIPPLFQPQMTLEEYTKASYQLEAEGLSHNHFIRPALPSWMGDTPPPLADTVVQEIHLASPEVMKSALPEYVLGKKMYAVQIESLEYFGPLDLDGITVVVPADKRFRSINVPNQWMLKNRPQPGGYFMVYDDGYMTYMPQESFERLFTLKRTELPSTRGAWA